MSNSVFVIAHDILVDLKKMLINIGNVDSFVIYTR